MRDTELCMKYDRCARCPLNKKCTESFNKWEKEKKRRQERLNKIKEKGKWR